MPHNKRFTIRMTLLSSFVLACVLLAIVAIGLHYYFSHAMATQAAKQQFELIAKHSADMAAEQEHNAIGVVSSLKQSIVLNEIEVSELNTQVVAGLTSLLAGNPRVSALFMATEKGEYLELVNLESEPNMRALWGAAPSDRWLLVQVLEEQGEYVKHVRYLNGALIERFKVEKATDFRAKSSTWYGLAQANKVTKQPPSLFHFIDLAGTRYISAHQNGHILGAITTFSALSQYLHFSGYQKSGNALIFNQSGEILAQRQASKYQALKVEKKIQLTAKQERNFVQISPIRVGVMDDYPPFEYQVSGQPRGYSVAHIELLAQKLNAELEMVNGYSFSQLVNMFNNDEIDVLLSMMVTPERQENGLFLAAHHTPAMIAVTREVERRNITKLDDVASLKVALQKGYAMSAILQRSLPNTEFVEFDDTLLALQGLKQKQVDVVFDSHTVMEYLRTYFYLEHLRLSDAIALPVAASELGLHHYVRKELPELAMLLSKAQQDLAPELRQQLHQRWLNFSQLGSDNSVLKQLPSKEILRLAKEASGQGQFHSLAMKERDYFLYVIPLKGSLGEQREYIALFVSTDEALGELMQYIRKAIAVSVCVLVVVLVLVIQLSRLISTPIQHLIVENQKVAQRRYKEVRYVTSNIEEIHLLSTSLVAMSESICEYERAQKELLDAMIQLIAQAIDEKSPYTGGHCARVPELGKLLVNAASNSKEPAFSDFALKSKEQWREFEVAAWLHDCGKINTPEHIVDKGTKLECIYNRIHEVRMRFEVLWRDNEIAYLQQCQTKPNDAAQLKERYEYVKQQLQEEFAFVAACNVGGEFMNDEDKQRLEKIGKRTWYRYFDDRLGLSPVEQDHLADTPHNKQGEEQLLADKDTHITVRQECEFKRNEGYGFNMTPTQNKKNLGEIYNLSISRGTLTDEDRYIINEHIITTIRMLEALPFPPELQNVPEYAGGHHEKLDGTGYPKGLNGAQMSIPAKILAIADIFEALTASDRPYKKAKTLSESLKIMKFMAADQHIDANLFALFLQSGIYEKYAQRFLDPEQIDEVNIEDYLPS